MSTEPVTAESIAALISLVFGSVLAKVGVDTDGVKQVVAYAFAIVGGAVAVWRILRARAKVTPLVAPKTVDGTPLVPMKNAA